MVEAEPAIRQLLRLDFEPKISQTIQCAFRQTINPTIKTLVLPMANEQADAILQQYPKAGAYLEQTLEKEAEGKIKLNSKLLNFIEQKITVYNQTVLDINSCLQAILLNQHQLPIIENSDLTAIPGSPESEGFDYSPNVTLTFNSGAVEDT